MDNLFLASLAKTDLATVEALIHPYKMEHKKVLFETGETISKVYFPTTAIVSLVVLLSTGETVESAMVGRDGMVGGSSAIDGKLAVCRAIIQVDGEGYAGDASAFKEAAMSSRSLHSKVIRHEQSLFAQAQQSTACIATHHVEARMARWLLRARDLADSNQLNFTQEFLAEMLGVQRSSVSTVAIHLQRNGVIEYNRGTIHITNLAGLKTTSCECYGTVKKHYRDLLGT